MADYLHALAEGFRIDQYEFQGVLGLSEAGIKYFCLDHELGRRVAAMECLPNSLVTRQVGGAVVPQSSAAKGVFNELLEQFLKEADVAAQFRHPNMVQIHRSLRANGTGYVMMDYVEGETRSALLTRTGAMPGSRLMALASPLMDCLAAMHEAHLLHLDIRPGNIVLGAVSPPILLSHGLRHPSAAGARQAFGEDRRRPRMTVSHSPYTAFELYSKHGRIGPWTDIYSLGATFYHCIAGRPPSAALDRLMQDDVAALAGRHKDSADGRLLAAIDEALCLYADDRPERIEIWRETLSGTPRRRGRDRVRGGGARIAARGPVRAGETRTSKGTSTKNRLRWTIPALALLAATAVIAYLDTQVLRAPSPGRDAIARVDGVGAAADEVEAKRELEPSDEPLPRSRVNEQEPIAEGGDEHVLAVSYGTLTLELEPEDAAATIPGAGGEGYTPRMKLREGHHDLQVSRAGYRAAVTRVLIAGDTRIRVALERERLCELRVLSPPSTGRYPATSTILGHQSVGSASVFVTFTVDDDGTVVNEGLRVDSERSQVEFPRHFIRFADAATETVLQYRFAFEEPDDGTCTRRQPASVVIHFRVPSRI